MRPPDHTFPHLGLARPATYEIVVQGTLDERWADWFEGLSIARERSSAGAPLTVLTGSVADQAALQGMLRALYTLGFPLCSVLCTGPAGLRPSGSTPSAEG